MARFGQVARTSIYLAAFGGIAGGWIWLSMPKTSNSSPLVPRTRKLPAVDRLMSDSETLQILSANERKRGSSSILMELNAVASNSPIEDYHSEHIYKNGYIAGLNQLIQRI